MKKHFNLARSFLRGLAPKKYPNVAFVVGAQKAGISSLFAYLVRHPLIAGSDVKEPHFFDRDAEYVKGTRYYKSRFPVFTSATHALEATPNYLYRKQVAARIHAYRPDAKIIAVLREPVSRAFSAFNMYQQIMSPSRPKETMLTANQDAKDVFEPLMEKRVEATIDYFLDREMEIISKGLEAEEPGLIRRGIYAPQLACYFDHFGRANVHVLFSNDLLNDPERVTNQIIDFLGLPPLRGEKYPKKHVREYSAELAAKEVIRQRAGVWFEQDKAELKERFGIEVPMVTALLVER